MMKLACRMVVAVAATLVFAGQGWAAAVAPAADNALIVLGDKLWAEGKIDEARKSFEQAVVAMPTSVEARMKLGGILLANRLYADAVRAYQGVVSLDRKNAKAWIGMGLAYRHNRQRDLADAAFEEAIRLEPIRKAQLEQLMQSAPEAAR